MKEMLYLTNIFLRDHIRTTWQKFRQRLHQTKITDNELFFISLTLIFSGIGGTVAGIIWLLNLGTFLLY